MEFIRRKDQPLKMVFIEYLLSAGLGFIAAILLTLLTLMGLNEAGFILSANHTENLILENKDKISNTIDFDQSLVPNGASYLLLTLNGEKIQSNMSPELETKAIDFHNREVISTPSSSFIEFRRPEGYIVIHYLLEPHYQNEWMERHFPKIDLFFTCLFILFCLISVLIVTLIWAKRMTRQLAPIFDVAANIAKQELDFQIGRSHIREFNDVLTSLEQMKNALSDSLRENWIQEENKRSQISALTHDLKIPLSIVQGNAELLKGAQLTEEEKIYLDYIIKNTNRISAYTKALILMNQSGKLSDTNLQKTPLAKLIEKSRDIAHEMTFAHGRRLSESIQASDQFVMLDLQLYERVFQNILSNAIAYSPYRSTVELNIYTTDRELIVSILDHGQGFTKEDLVHGTEQFYRGDKSRQSPAHYGLGLYISAQIMALHHGRIILANRHHEAGAVVKLEIPFC